MNKMSIPDLEATAADIRRHILKTIFNAGCGHTGGSLSEADILTALFFRIMNIDTSNPRMENRDRFILSKGHSTPGYYCTLAKRGFFPLEVLMTFDQEGTILQGHPDMHKTPGVDISSGSLGQGLSLGIGMCTGRDANNLDFCVYTLLGDGESQEGQVWEAAMYAGANKTKGLIGITDYNGVQLSGEVNNILSLGSLKKKWEAFDWTVLECDGHSMTELVSTLENAKNLSKEGPVMILAKTVKGKGVSFMENNYHWHGKAPNKEEYALAIKELER